MSDTDTIQARRKIISEAVADLREGGKLWDALCGIQVYERGYVTAYVSHVEFFVKLGMPESILERWKRGKVVEKDREKILLDIEECWRVLATSHKTFDSHLLCPDPASWSENSCEKETPAIAQYRKKVIKQVWFLSRLISEISESVKEVTEHRWKVKLGVEPLSGCTQTARYL